MKKLLLTLILFPSILIAAETKPHSPEELANSSKAYLFKYANTPEVATYANTRIFYLSNGNSIFPGAKGEDKYVAEEVAEDLASSSGIPKEGIKETAVLGAAISVTCHMFKKSEAIIRTNHDLRARDNQLFRLFFHVAAAAIQGNITSFDYTPSENCEHLRAYEEGS